MDWSKCLNQAIAYIEEHLTGEMDYETLGRIACCSSFHFQRMFTYMAGLPLSEYIRRRKMTLAAQALLRGEKVLDVALRYGYSSPTAFNRAFQSIQGVAPSAVRAPGVTIKSFAPLAFRMIVKGVEEMNYRIEKKDAFRVIGRSCAMPREVEESFRLVPQFWEQCAREGVLARLSEQNHQPPMGLMGVCACYGEDWRYYIAVSSSQPVGEFEEYIVPAATWAIFSGSGEGRSIQALEQRIVAEWLPSSGYEYGEGPDLELYLTADGADGQYEVWLPVVEKRD